LLSKVTSEREYRCPYRFDKTVKATDSSGYQIDATIIGCIFRVSLHPYVGKVSVPFWLNV
jgi:hypothetical protein